MDSFDSDFLDDQDAYLWAFDQNAYQQTLPPVRSDISQFLPPGESVEEFADSIERLSRPSSIVLTQSNSPTSFEETPEVRAVVHLGIAQDIYGQGMSHAVKSEFGEFFLPERRAEDSANHFELLSGISSVEITEANTPNSSDGSSSKDSKKRSFSADSSPVKRTKGNGGSRFRTEAERQETRSTREKGACLPCQESKRRCIPGPDPNGPCSRCLERNMRPGLPLCNRPKIRDIEVFRRGPTVEYAWSSRWKLREVKPEAKSIWKPITELPTSRSDETKIVELSQGHAQENLRLRVRRYGPEPDDKQYYTWYEGDERRTYDTEPYAIADLGYARNALRKFLDRNVRVYLNVLLRKASPITKATFQAALQNQDLTLLEPALKLWVASRFIETPWHIAGSETLGMSKDPRANSPYHEFIPQTPIMDFQLDNLVIYSILQPLLKEVLNTLRTKSLANRLEDWFELQLTHYILLNTIEVTMAHDVEFAKRYNMKSQWSNCPLIEMVTQGANTLLTYFHSANKRHYPFSGPWPEVERAHQWSREQKSYILEIRRLLGQQQQVATEPAKEMFWTGQLHRAEWSAVSVALA